MAKLLLVLSVLGLLTVVAVPAALLGAPVDVDVKSKGVNDALAFAMNEYNRRSNAMFANRAVHVMQAQRQVVGGYMYTLKVQTGRTNCRNPATNLKDCELQTESSLAKSEECKFKVFSRPWMHEYSLEKFECH
ncbi:cystatin-like [Gastrophryne carolinensis]